MRCVSSAVLVVIVGLPAVAQQTYSGPVGCGPLTPRAGWRAGCGCGSGWGYDSAIPVNRWTPLRPVGADAPPPQPLVGTDPGPVWSLLPPVGRAAALSWTGRPAVTPVANRPDAGQALRDAWRLAAAGRLEDAAAAVRRGLTATPAAHWTAAVRAAAPDPTVAAATALRVATRAADQPGASTDVKLLAGVFGVAAGHTTRAALHLADAAVLDPRDAVARELHARLVRSSGVTSPPPPPPSAAPRAR
jgi:hypothetical protein